MNLSKTTTLAGLLVALTAFLAAAPAKASIVLSDLNSTLSIDPSSQAGAFSWTVDNVEQLSKQWFWYRIGSTAEQSVDTLTLNAATGNGTPVGLISYTGPGFNLSLTYVLTGGTSGSGVSDVGETLRITNTSGSPLDFHFFQYTDFDLNATANNDFLRYTANNTVQQFDGSVIASETVVTPPPQHRQGDFFPVILNSLNDGAPTTLNDQPPVLTTIGPGDLTWGYEWDRTIATGGTFIISKDKTLAPNVGQPPLPEAGSLAIWGLLGLTTVSVFYFRRHRMPAMLQA
jgi:hypothetical protein